MKIRKTASIFAAVSLLVMKPIGFDTVQASNQKSDFECAVCHSISDVINESYEHVKKSDTPSRSANGSEMSRWCDNCHVYGSQPEEASDTRSSHPLLDPSMLPVAGAGNSSSSMNAGIIKGDSVSSRLKLLLLDSNYHQVKADTPRGFQAAAADESAALMCTSCHLAHAGGFHQILQRKNTAEHLFSGSRNTACCYPQEEIGALDNDSPPGTFGDYRRTLCCKCHSREKQREAG